MDKALNEIGKLRNEMKIGFIELENQMQANDESLREEIKRTSEALQENIKRTSELTIGALDKFAQKVEAGFIAVEEALDDDISEIKKELLNIRKRLDDANL